MMMMNSSEDQSDAEPKPATVIEIGEPQTIVQQQKESSGGGTATKTNTVITMMTAEKTDESAKNSKPDRIDDTTTSIVNSNKETKINGNMHTNNSRQQQQQQPQQLKPQSFGEPGKKKNTAFISRDAVHASATSTTFNEYFIPVNEHRKFMRGEKLYLTMDKRDKKKGFAKYACCFTTFFILSVALVLLILTGIGIIFQSEIQNEYGVKDETSVAVSSRHFRPDIKTGGHSGIFDAVVDADETEKQPAAPPSTTTIQPSMSTIQTYTRFEVPNSLEAILRISNLDYVPEFDDKSSDEYKQFAKRFETWLRSSLFDFQTLEYSPATILLRLIDIDPQTFEIKFRIGWMYMDEKMNGTLILTRSDLETRLERLIVSETARTSDSDSEQIPYEFDTNFVRVTRVENKCEIANGDCAEKCSFRFLALDFKCECYDGRDELDDQGCQTDSIAATVTMETSSPAVATAETSSPVAATMETSSPVVATVETSSPTVATMEITSPVVATVETSSSVVATAETSSPTLATTVDENEEDTDDETAPRTTTEPSDNPETTESTLIPFGNDALAYPNAAESNPAETGETFMPNKSAEMTATSSQNDNEPESPTIEMFIVENDSAGVTSSSQAPFNAPVTHDPSRASESDFLNEVNDDDVTNRTSANYSTSTKTMPTPIVPSSNTPSTTKTTTAATEESGNIATELTTPTAELYEVYLL